MRPASSVQNLYGWFDDEIEPHSPTTPTHTFRLSNDQEEYAEDGSPKPVDVEMEEDQCESQITMKSFMYNGQMFTVQVSIPKFRIVQRDMESRFDDTGPFRKYFGGCWANLDRHAEYLVVMQLGDYRHMSWKRSREFAQLVKGLPPQFENTKALWPTIVNMWSTRSLQPHYLFHKCIVLERLLQELVFEAPEINALSSWLSPGNGNNSSIDLKMGQMTQ